MAAFRRRRKIFSHFKAGYRANASIQTLASLFSSKATLLSFFKRKSENCLVPTNNRHFKVTLPTWAMCSECTLDQLADIYQILISFHDMGIIVLVFKGQANKKGEIYLWFQKPQRATLGTISPNWVFALSFQVAKCENWDARDWGFLEKNPKPYPPEWILPVNSRRPDLESCDQVRTGAEGSLNSTWILNSRVYSIVCLEFGAHQERMQEKGGP